ncbi:hypothetical protein RFI_08148 [Reticulomyxa filosa]|uniref:Uncharacterized protein n=1 Tax=Reticulomyxa filosa TaxID=46433 RepID=X6NRR9_RETFI|nr:hypothetical protein RFI_08148 [Reticulomyxa filosa]|eukprot:ETO28975.1 hypothetical protein RFI_08148 [Reticulomyxa filosa]
MGIVSLKFYLIGLLLFCVLNIIFFRDILVQLSKDSDVFAFYQLGTVVPIEEKPETETMSPPQITQLLRRTKDDQNNTVTPHRNKNPINKAQLFKYYTNQNQSLTYDINEVVPQQLQPSCGLPKSLLAREKVNYGLWHIAVKKKKIPPFFFFFFFIKKNEQQLNDVISKGEAMTQNDVKEILQTTQWIEPRSRKKENLSEHKMPQPLCYVPMRDMSLNPMNEKDQRWKRIGFLTMFALCKNLDLFDNTVTCKKDVTDCMNKVAKIIDFNESEVEYVYGLYETDKNIAEALMQLF